jgi:hypothetical protein
MRLAVQNASFLQAGKELWLKELRYADILTQTLSPSRLEDEIASSGLRACRLKRPKNDVFIKRITRDDGPAIKDEGHSSLALSVDSKIRLEAERVDNGDKATNAVEWCAGDRAIRKDVTATASENCVQRGNGICRSGHGTGVDGLH